MRQATGSGNYYGITRTDTPDGQGMVDVETFGRKRKRDSSLEVSDGRPPAPPLGTTRAEPVESSDRHPHADGVAHRVVRREMAPPSTASPNSERRQSSTSSSSSSSSSSDSPSSSDENVDDSEPPKAEVVTQPVPKAQARRVSVTQTNARERDRSRSPRGGRELFSSQS